MTVTLSFKVSNADRALIDQIVERALDLIDLSETLTKRDRAARRVNLTMDITACHASGNPLRLADMAEDTRGFSLMHDVAGISRHIDRDTGALRNCFVPRFSQREDVTA